MSFRIINGKEVSMSRLDSQKWDREHPKGDVPDEKVQDVIKTFVEKAGELSNTEEELNEAIKTLTEPKQGEVTEITKKRTTFKDRGFGEQKIK